MKKVIVIILILAIRLPVVAQFQIPPPPPPSLDEDTNKVFTPLSKEDSLARLEILKALDALLLTITKREQEAELKKYQNSLNKVHYQEIDTQQQPDLPSIFLMLLAFIVVFYMLWSSLDG